MCLFLSALAAQVKAAEIRLSKAAALATLILEGEIVAGDYAKIKLFLNDNCSDDLSVPCFRSIYLASPGGNVTEAMKIGTLVRNLRLTTLVPENSPSIVLKAEQGNLKDPRANYMCASACFFIAVAGIDREVSPYNPILGIHRPFIADSELAALNANQVIESSTRFRTIVESYLKEMNVPCLSG